MKITSRKNEKVLHMKKLGASREYRREQGAFFCDGAKLLEEAMRWGAGIRCVMSAEPLALTLPAGTEYYEVTRDIIEAVSPMKTPQNVVFSVDTPRGAEDVSLRGAVILENMQDPGNVGTVLRTANAFGVKHVILTGASADPWSPKTVRASMGAVFRQRIAELTLSEIASLKTPETPLYGAALSEGARDIRFVELSACAVAVGNEGSGLTEEFLSLCDGTVIIPMMPACESLNAAAAAAVLMWRMAGEKLPGEACDG